MTTIKKQLCRVVEKQLYKIELTSLILWYTLNLLLEYVAYGDGSMVRQCGLKLSTRHAGS